MGGRAGLMSHKEEPALFFPLFLPSFPSVFGGGRRRRPGGEKDAWMVFSPSSSSFPLFLFHDVVNAAPLC